MNRFSIAVALVSATFATAASANVTVNFSSTTAVPSNNDFKSQLNALGLSSYAAKDASIILDTNSIITFEFLGTESGFNDTFSTATLSATEFTSFLDAFASPIPIGSGAFNAGSLASLLNFSSVGGKSATVGQEGFGIFLGPNQTSGQSFSTFYFGYDDQITRADDDYDDMIIRATVRSAVPEPATWAMMMLGFGAIGFSLRRKSQQPRAIPLPASVR